jgi:predicted regulator of Ras-like GTPase activity (Roadblock/LC7/MglB family)
MPATDLILHEQDFQQIQHVANSLLRDANAKMVFVVDRNGQTIASSGNLGNIDQTSLASLTAGNVAATEGLAQLIGEQEFSVLFHEGKRDNLHISTIGRTSILVVAFDERTSLGLVRLRVRKAGAALETIFEQVTERARSHAGGVADPFGSPFAEITDEDIENLFSD